MESIYWSSHFFSTSSNWSLDVQSATRLFILDIRPVIYLFYKTSLSSKLITFNWCITSIVLLFLLTKLWLLTTNHNFTSRKHWLLTTNHNFNNQSTSLRNAQWTWWNPHKPNAITAGCVMSTVHSEIKMVVLAKPLISCG